MEFWQFLNQALWIKLVSENTAEPEFSGKQETALEKSELKNQFSLKHKSVKHMVRRHLLL